MSELIFARKDGDRVALPAGTVAGLSSRLRGAFVTAADSDYEPLRKVWNSLIDRRPACIVQAAGIGDVQAVVSFAAERDLLLAVRGGGHSAAGYGVPEQGIMLDLSRMRSVRVDEKQRCAWVEGGATWRDLDAATEPFGLAAVGGMVGSTGVAGVTLGGGFGWLTRLHGLACDNLVSAELVTANGERLNASEEENPELLWGLKGGGGNFGIVTRLQLRLHSVPPRLFAGMLAYPTEEAEAALALLRDVMAEAPDSLSAVGAFSSMAEGQPVVLICSAYFGAAARGEELLAPLRKAKAPLFDSMAPISYGQLQSLFDLGGQRRQRCYWRSSFLESVPNAAIATIVAQERARPSPQSAIVLEFLRGAYERTAPGAAAFQHRGALCNLLVTAQWEAAEDDFANRDWALKTVAALAPHATGGVYLNYQGSEDADRETLVPQVYSPETYARLVALKQRYDPTNLFRMNLNISPG